jgi:steroid delta-isomerase-like uncharacterized protein
MTARSPRFASSKALIGRYNAAWNAHEVEAILAMHTDDSVFENHTSGGHGVGKDSIREIVTGVFATFPDIIFRTRREYFGEGFAVQEWTATASFNRPIVRDDVRLQPTGKKLEWNGVDIIVFKGSLVARKDVYTDALSFLRQIGGR